MRCTVPVPSRSDLATHTLDSAPPPKKPLNYDRLWIGCSVLLQRLGGGGTWSSADSGLLSRRGLASPAMVSDATEEERQCAKLPSQRYCLHSESLPSSRRARTQ